jgi:hypothetical protein
MVVSAFRGAPAPTSALRRRVILKALAPATGRARNRSPGGHHLPCLRTRKLWMGEFIGDPGAPLGVENALERSFTLETGSRRSVPARVRNLDRSGFEESDAARIAVACCRGTKGAGPCARPIGCRHHVREGTARCCTASSPCPVPTHRAPLLAEFAHPETARRNAPAFGTMQTAVGRLAS